MGELAVAMAVDSGVGVTSGVRAAPALGACMTPVVSAKEVFPTWTTTERCGHSSTIRITAIRITAMTRTIRIAIRIPPTTILNTATTALRIALVVFRPGGQPARTDGFDRSAEQAEHPRLGERRLGRHDELLTRAHHVDQCRSLVAESIDERVP